MGKREKKTYLYRNEADLVSKNPVGAGYAAVVD
jgi:hypothetical protein